MPMKAALTARIVPARRLLPVAALWAFLGRVCLVDSLDSDSSELGFLLDHPSKLAMGPLVQPLIYLAVVFSLLKFNTVNALGAPLVCEFYLN